MNIYISNLSYGVNDGGLKDLFGGIWRNFLCKGNY